MGLNWFFNGVPIFSDQGRQWISQRTGQDVKSAKVAGRVSRCRGHFSHTLLGNPSSLHLSPERTELPVEDAARKIFTTYFRSSFWLMFPVLDRVLFEETLDITYGAIDAGNLSSPKHVSARACVLSALSVACRLKETKLTSHAIDAAECGFQAECLIPSNAGDVSLTTLEATLMLVRPSILGSLYVFISSDRVTKLK